MPIVRPIFVYPLPYVFQEIQNVKTKSVFGYEALLRPENGMSAIDFVNNRIMMGGTHQLEIDSFYNATKLFSELRMPGYLFINSLPNECFEIHESLNFVDTYGPEIVSRIVVETMQFPMFDKELWYRKQRFMLRHDMLSALDGFGTGLNSDFTSVAFYKPDIVKIAKEIIHDFPESQERTEYVKNLVQTLKEQDVRVLAEGIENVVEYEMLKEFGIDLAQGYYIAMPGIPEPPPFIEDGDTRKYTDDVILGD